MSTLKNVNDSPTRRHVHPPATSIEETTERCPLCGQPVTKAQYSRIQEQIEAQVRARLEEAEKTLRDKLAREQQQAIAKVQAEVEKAKKDAAAQVEKAKRDAASREAAIRQQVTKAATAALAPKIAEAVNTEKQRSYAEKLNLSQQLEDMKRRLEKKTAGELGDEAEMDLLSALKREFAGDEITRVAKGVPGADIVQRIVHNGTVVGMIIYECKNHKRWQNSFTARLRQNQLSTQADHGVLVLAAGAFPADLRQRRLAVRDNVIIVVPQMAIPLVHLLRRQTIQMHVLRLGNEARAEKSEKLYEFMTSARAAHLWDQIADATNDLEALDRAEKISHERTWGRRAHLHVSLKQGIHSFHETVNLVIGTTGSEASP